MRARGHLLKLGEKSGIAKKELAEKEHDGYDTHHETYPSAQSLGCFDTAQITIRND
jgi:hypothetical protein